MRRGFLAKRTTVFIRRKQTSSKRPHSQSDKKANKLAETKSQFSGQSDQNTNKLVETKSQFSKTLHYHCLWSKTSEIKKAIRAQPNCIEEINNEKETPLFTAIYMNRKDVVSLFVSSGANVNAKRKDGDTPLILACKNKYNKIAEILLKNGADVDVKDKSDKTPLRLAVEKQNSELVELLINFKANLNPKNSLLELAIEINSLKIVKVLLEHGVSLMHINPATNATPLITACRKGNLAIVKEILNYNPELNCFDIDDHGPLHHAILHQHIELVELLLASGIDVNSQSPSLGDTVLHFISKYFSKQSEMDLDTSSEDELSDLDEDEIDFSMDLFVNAFRYFMMVYNQEHNYDEEEYFDEEEYYDEEEYHDEDEDYDEEHLTSDEEDETDVNHHQNPLSNVEKNVSGTGQPGINNQKGLITKLKKIIKLLLSAGANIDAQNDHHNTPLHVACLFKQPQIAQIYVNHKAKVNLLNKRHLTALHYAIQQELPKEFIQLLLRNGAFADIGDAKGNTPMHYCKKNSIFKLLLSYGADINCENEYKNVTFKLFKFKNKRDMGDIYRHVIKLKTLGYEISDTIEDIMDAHCQDDFRSFKEKLLKELKKMKKIVLNRRQGVTLYHLLFKKLQNLLPYMKNSTLNRVYEQTGRDFQTKYRYYGYLLNSKCEKAKKRLEILEPAKETFQAVVGNCLPEPCYEGVLSFLNNDVLKDLITIDL